MIEGEMPYKKEINGLRNVPFIIFAIVTNDAIRRFLSGSVLLHHLFLSVITEAVSQGGGVNESKYYSQYRLDLRVGL